MTGKKVPTTRQQEQDQLQQERSKEGDDDRWLLLPQPAIYIVAGDRMEHRDWSTQNLVNPFLYYLAVLLLLFNPGFPLGGGGIDPSTVEFFDQSMMQSVWVKVSGKCHALHDPHYDT